MSELTRLLRLVRDGDADAADRLTPLVYDELRRLAAAQMRHERAGQTLQPTALVHEAYLRLLTDGAPDWESSAHFFGAAAEAMRRILVERARRRNRLRHGGGRNRVELDNALVLDMSSDPALVVAIDEAIERLRQFDPRLHDLVKLRCFAGLTLSEAAGVLGVSSRTLDRDWVVARAWLRKELSCDEKVCRAGPPDVA
jgi:RNA polymerase sigma factor (TIGR02999 family)